MKQLQTLKGFRDFLPAEKRARDFIEQKVIETFSLFGFEPLETPTLEYAELLLGKYGDEADKLVYTFTDRGNRQIALRYDQTVPTARVLAHYQNELPKYFRRYQIQNVFRADKPQKGRYREFTQCDIDIFNTTSPIADAEILACTYQAFKNVGFANIKLTVNDRFTLFETLSPFATKTVSVFSIIQSIDKLDKLPPEAVATELVTKGLELTAATAILEALKKASISTNLETILTTARALGVPAESLIVSPSLARGLDYYTGMIFEVLLPDYPGSSCGGGGRYDSLINHLSGQQVPAVGVAFGFDRMVEAATALNLIPTKRQASPVLVALLSDTLIPAALEFALYLRSNGVATEVYPVVDKLAKQFQYATKKELTYVALLGESEAAQNKITLKNIQTGDQWLLDKTECLARL